MGALTHDLAIGINQETDMAHGTVGAVKSLPMLQGTFLKFHSACLAEKILPCLLAHKSYLPEYPVPRGIPCRCKVYGPSQSKNHGACGRLRRTLACHPD